MVGSCAGVILHMDMKDSTASKRCTWRLCGEFLVNVLQLIPCGIVVLIFPEPAFTCPGLTAEATTIFDAAVASGTGHSIAFAKQWTFRNQFFHPDFGLHIS